MTLNKDLMSKKLYLQVFDEDALIDDKLGELYIDWQKCLKNPGSWVINNVF